MIEIDGETHFQKAQLEYDQARTEYLERLGYKLIRFTNYDIRYNLNAVIAGIIEQVETRVKNLS